MISFIRKVIENETTLFYCLIFASIIDNFFDNYFRACFYFFCSIFYFGCIKIANAILYSNKLKLELQEIKSIINQMKEE